MSYNRLSQEKSPYLLQHKDNPVWWYPWGDEAFEAAQKENKPIFLSIGYSTCHWCHVMEKDSFEKQDVADILNTHFICIKLDREERPDIDAVYMNAVQSMTGGGGWPMSVLLTTDGKPFWGGTFLAHHQFKDLLQRVVEVWQSDRQQMIEAGEQAAQYLSDHADMPTSEFTKASEASLIQFVEGFRTRFDKVHGGNVGAPKFPATLTMMTLLRVHRRTDNKEILAMVEKTLSEMRRGGIYDHVGGGFHRYSVDDHWLIPHFEKMLYDNALLASAFLETYQVTQKPEYSRTAREILDYIARDMTHADGGFFSAEDADSEHIEGKFYVWSFDELQKLLTHDELSEVQNTFNVTPAGNFQAHKTGDEVNERRFDAPAITGNVFFIKSDANLPSEENTTLTMALKKLFKARTQRKRPHLDDKILVSWNALMISAMAKGFQVLSEEKYLERARRAADFILTHMRGRDGGLLRSHRDGESRHRAMADDYAFFIEALLDLYQSDFDPRWYAAAVDLQKIQNELFWDRIRGAYFENDGSDKNVITRNKSYEDNVIPSANSVAALNLVRLFELSGEISFKNQTEQIIKAASVFLERYPGAIPKLLFVVDRLTDIALEVAIVLPTIDDPTMGAGMTTETAAEEIITFVRSGFFPNVTMAVKDKDEPQSEIPLLRDRVTQGGITTFYVCQNQACKLPLIDVKQVKRDIKELIPYLV